ncbi:DUF748 domain-containing protein [Proteobacteria bacterium 005FR1]|nr:DUF748 domain-containing protein [Proteobacteria bacterium 005FR1]
MKTRKNVAIVASLLLLLGGLRLALPWILEDYINDHLANLEGYDGQVGDIDVALWRGAYQIQAIQIHKEQQGSLEPFFTGELIDLSVDWRKLLDGSLVAELTLINPQLNLVEAEDERQSQTGADVDWAERIDELFPFRFEQIVVRDGTIRFRTPAIETKDALVARQVNGKVQNLTNTAEIAEEAFASFEFASRILDAPIHLEGKVNPTAQDPTFDMNLRLEKVNLTDLNPWLREYLNADAQGGTFAVYTELAAADGRFEGYVKPFAENVDLYDLGEKTDGFLQSAWEAALNFAAEIFEYQPEQEAATRIPVGGELDDPEAGILAAAFNVLRNAIGGTFARSLEHSVTLDENSHVEESEPKEGESQ